MEIVFGLFGLVVVGLLFASLIIPWVNHRRISSLRIELQNLDQRLANLSALLEKQDASLPKTVPEAPTTQPPQASGSASPSPATTHSTVDALPQPPKFPHQSPPEPDPAPSLAVGSSPPEKTDQQKISFEQQWGARLPVWIGGVALALAGFFLVKYSIETGLLTPSVRVILGLIFGFGLLAAGHWVRRQPDFADGTRIAQALSGAGIADLYGSVFAATSLYQLVPNWAGFAGMAAVTGAAVVLSLRQGMPIALLGLIGGFLTPVLVGSSEPQAPLLFLYLYFVLTGLLLTIRSRGWWWMAIPTVIGAFLWVVIWLLSNNFGPSDSLWLGLFLIAVSATVIVVSQPVYGNPAQTDSFRVNAVINYLALAGALLLMGAVTAQSNFGTLEWGLFGLLAVGSMGLAYFDQRLYGVAPWLSMAVNIVILATWPWASELEFAVLATLFAILHAGGGYWLQWRKWRSPNPILWAGLTAAASLGYYLLGYFELYNHALGTSIPLFWGLLALALSSLAGMTLWRMGPSLAKDDPRKQQLFAIYTSMAAAFFAIGLAVELDRDFLPMALAGQVLAMAWINNQVYIHALRPITAALAGLFVVLLLPQLLQLFGWALSGLFDLPLASPKYLPIAQRPSFHLGLPALCFVVGSYLLRRQRDDRLVQWLEMTAIALGGILGYYWVRHAFHVDILSPETTFFERGVTTQVFFIYGLACMEVGRRLDRRTIAWGGLTLIGLALCRIGYLDFIAYNPLWSPQAVGEWPMVNSLLLTYGLPIVWIWYAARSLNYLDKQRWRPYGYSIMPLLAFTWVSLNVRQFFQGNYLDAHSISNPEIYSYSAAWLLFGIGLLFLGTLRQNKPIRIASLAIMIVTVAKVFLYDASELEGLYRVFSFFGLGLSLLGLSWFYTRFVFGKIQTPGSS